MKNNKLSSLKYWFLSSVLKTNSEKGYVIVIAMAVLFGLAALVAVYARTSRFEQISNTTTVDTTSGFYGAEAALNQRANEITAIYQSNSVPNGISPKDAEACFDNAIDDGDGDYKCKTYSFSGGDSDRSDYSATTYVLEKDGGEGKVGNVPPGDKHAGLNMIEYGHSVIALAFKDSDVQQKQQQGSDEGRGAIAILQMDIKNRLIPMFQFAAFYKDDLEIFPGADMNLSGPVHTNGELYIGGKLKKIKGEVSSVGTNFYASQDSETAKKIKTTPTLIPENQYEVERGKFQMFSIKIGIDPLGLPEPDFLNDEGEYFQKADIRINFTPIPTNTSDYGKYVPFEIEVIERTNNLNQPITPVTTSLTNTTLPPGLTTLEKKESQHQPILHSLRQPILVSETHSSIAVSSETFDGNSQDSSNNNRQNPNYTEARNPNFNICQPVTVNNSTWNGLAGAAKTEIAVFAHNFLQEKIQQNPTPVLFTNLDKDLANTGISGLTFSETMTGAPASLDATIATELNTLTPNQIAALAYPDATTGNIVTRCFIPAPLTDIGRDDGTHSTPFRFYNKREAKDMRLLQMNMKSLVVWNFEGKYWDTTASTPDLKPTNQLLFKTAPVDSSAPANSFQALGMAGRDTSDDGLVFYATVNPIDPSGTTTNTDRAASNSSPYGFAIVEGNQLPGLGLSNTFNTNDATGLTFASDQAAYVQGDYNTRNKQPASILADSINVLSNTCYDPNKVIHRLNNQNCNSSVTGNALGNPTLTIINSAFLGGNDVSTPGGGGNLYNGGLENYPRFHEQWGTLRYRGSFVSIATPNHVSGTWRSQQYSAPRREWDYDLMFNDARNLPPLTPRFSSMKQEQFIRSFE